ncbi:carbohydrate sulfotransferase 11-like [Mizuhopecten yessoensis]|uniref:Carbohydrate sulfotransferase n=1 Tax=Mizuhopecten yessoensis TaxID=6573 RepID=A0A210PDX1_MIZYE|nr:carbohydrate sulfotransferase 11-like [Mizuhopecten yessoensis]OWF34695.1 Carbohydrate sulfotransferase 14 [Mizuhopecten yessoensis]
MRPKKLTVLVLLVSFFVLVAIFIKPGNTPTQQDSALRGALLPVKSLPLDRTGEDGRTTVTSAENENKERVRHLRRECKHYRKDENGSQYLDYIIVDEKYKMMFCYIPKISCSQWKTVFISLTGSVNSSELNFGNVHTYHQSKLNFLRKYSFRRRQQMLEEYKKYIVVRNPLERLLSAYRNKLAGRGIKDTSFREAGKLIVKRIRLNATRESLKKGDDVTFLEFVKFLTDEDTKHLNDHWELYARLCRPCLINYDFVGKYETIKRDADFILKDIGAPPEVRFPLRSEKYSTEKTINTFDNFYSQIPADYIQKLYNRYRSDFDIFGYSLSDNLNVTSIP